MAGDLWKTIDGFPDYEVSSYGRVKSHKNKNGYASYPIEAKNIDTGEVTIYPSIMEADRQGFDNAHVIACCKGKRKTHKRHEWRYVNG